MTAPAAPGGYDTRELTSFERAGTLVEEFEAALKDCGIRISTESDLEFICLQVLELEYRRLNKTKGPPLEDIRAMWRRSGSLIEIMQLFLRLTATAAAKLSFRTLTS